MLRSKGMDISIEEAKQILEMLRKFGNILVADFIESKNKIKHEAAVA
jgi:hypothetical protein